MTAKRIQLKAEERINKNKSTRDPYTRFCEWMAWTRATGKGRAESGGSDLVLWVWDGWKQGDGMTVRVPVFSLHLRVAADGTVLWCSALENMSSCSTVPSGKMFTLLGRTPGTGLSAWRSWETSLELCSACCLGSSAGAQGTEGCAQVVLQAGWWMGVFPRSGTKVQKLIMKYSLNVVGKTIAWLSGVGRFPEMPESSSQPPQGHTVGAGVSSIVASCKRCANKYCPDMREMFTAYKLEQSRLSLNCSASLHLSHRKNRNRLGFQSFLFIGSFLCSPWDEHSEDPVHGADHHWLPKGAASAFFTFLTQRSNKKEVERALGSVNWLLFHG